MFALGLRYLCGWAMATHPASYSEPEWPPHPDRIFMALAAAHFEDEADPDERAALEWLEGAGAPCVAASEHTVRRPVTSYVPVNDVAAPKLPKRVDDRKLNAQIAAGLALLPERRSRQPRQFPVAIPKDPTAFLLWPDAQPTQTVRESMTRLCRKVARVGHSASLVQMWVDTNPAAPNWQPSDRNEEVRFRITGEGRLSMLEGWFSAGMRPRAPIWQPYARPRVEREAESAGSVFSPDLIVLRQTSGRPLGLVSTMLVTFTLRRAVMSAAAEPLPEWLTGHDALRRPSERPHVAFIPLPHVDARYADGHLLGTALLIPRDVPRDELVRVIGPVMRVASSTGLRVFNGNLIEATFSLGTEDGAPYALRPDTWTSAVRPSRRWATVTPIALDKYPKRNGDAEDAVALACQRIGLPRPSEIVVATVSAFRGVPPGPSFAPMRTKSSGSRFHVHAFLTFDAPIVGPVVLGAGRYRGYGLCRPLREEASS